MTLRQQLTDTMKQAMKAKDRVVLDTVRYVLSKVKNEEIDAKRELSDKEVTRILQKEVKLRKESVEQFLQGGRDDLAKEEKEKILVIQKFLPKEISDQDLETIVQKVLDEVGDNFGDVMKRVMPEIKGKADGKRVTQMVKKLLS